MQRDENYCAKSHDIRFADNKIVRVATYGTPDNWNYILTGFLLIVQLFLFIVYFKYIIHK